MNPGTGSNRTRNESGGRTDTNRNAETGITTEDRTTMTETVTIDEETTRIGIGMSETTPQTTTEEGMADGTRNDRGIRIIDATIEEDIFLGKSVGKQPEITIRD